LGNGVNVGEHDLELIICDILTVLYYRLSKGLPIMTPETFLMELTVSQFIEIPFTISGFFFFAFAGPSVIKSFIRIMRGLADRRKQSQKQAKIKL